MKILALDTTTQSCSAALLCDGQIFSCHEDIGSQKNTDLILPMIEKLLADAQIQKSQIQLIACARGPGSFTGVRVGVAISQALAAALGIPIATVSTLKLQALGLVAQNDLAEGSQIYVVNDAKIGEVYAAAYTLKNQQLTALEDEYLSAPQHLKISKINPLHKTITTGSAWNVYTALPQIPNAIYIDHAPSARYLLAEAQYLWQQHLCHSPAQALPIYLRNQVALKKAERGS